MVRHFCVGYPLWKIPSKLKKLMTSRSWQQYFRLWSPCQLRIELLSKLQNSDLFSVKIHFLWTLFLRALLTYPFKCISGMPWDTPVLQRTFCTSNLLQPRVCARFERTYFNCTNCKANFLVNYLLPKLQCLCSCRSCRTYRRWSCWEKLILYF